MLMLYLHHACYIILLDFILMDMKHIYDGRQNWCRCDFTKSTSPILQISRFQKICPLRSTKRPEMLTPKFFFEND